MTEKIKSLMSRIPGIGYLPLYIVTAAVPFLFYIIRGNGFYSLADDFIDQMIPFYVGMIRAVREGGFDSFSHCIDLGTSTVLGYTYYGLFSPFFWICLPFPEQSVPYLIGWVFILKYVVACYTAFLYLRRFVSRDVTAAAGAVAYAFSGYQCANLQFYFFHDAVALFPLLLIGVELVMDKKTTDRRRPLLLFAFFVFLNCITNYFFFVQEVLFLVLYFLFRFAQRDLRQVLHDIAGMLFAGILGTGLAAFVFFPNIMYILSNNRVTGGETTAAGFFHDFLHLMILWKGFLLPSDALMAQSSIMPVEMSIGSCFLPGGLLALTVAYIVKKKTDRLSLFLCLLAGLSLSPLLSSAFLLFVTDYYRWWYMMILMMLLAAVIVLENTDAYPVRRCLVAYLACVAAFVIAVLVLHDNEGNSLLLNARYFTCSVLLASSGAALLLIGKQKAALLSVCGVSVLTTVLSQHMLREIAYISPADYRDIYHIATQVHSPDPAFRFVNRENVLIFPSESGVTGTDCYTTTASSSLTEFDALFDFYDTDGDTRLYKRLIPGLPAALGAKYAVLCDLLTSESYTETELQSAGELSATQVHGHDVRLVEFPASPVAYAAQRFIRRSELKKLWGERRGIALLYAMVVYDEEVPLFEDLLTEVQAWEIDALIESDSAHFSGESLYLNRAIETCCAENNACGLQGLKRTWQGLHGTSQAAQETILYISLPIDAGWHAMIDGTEVPILHSCGMMALRVPAGTHEINLRYGAPYLKKGLLISFVSLAVFLFLWRSRHFS